MKLEFQNMEGPDIYIVTKLLENQNILYFKYTWTLCCGTKWKSWWSVMFKMPFVFKYNVCKTFKGLVLYHYKKYLKAFFFP